MNILLKKSCLLNIHEELEEKEVMNMDKSYLAGASSQRNREAFSIGVIMQLYFIHLS